MRYDHQPSTVTTILPPGEQRVYNRGDYLYLPTDRIETLFVLSQGGVKVGSYSATGREVTYDLLMPGDLIGNLHCLPDNTFSEYAKALTQVRVTVYPVRTFKRKVRDDTRLADAFQQMIVRRWCRAETRLFYIASLNGTQRVARLLEQPARRISDADGATYSIRDLLTQQDIADLCGLTRQTTSRILKKLSS